MTHSNLKNTCNNELRGPSDCVKFGFVTANDLNLIRRILARHKRWKCLATGSKELSSLSVCAPKWRFMMSLAKNILRFSPFWASKIKPPSQLATKGSEKLASFFRPIREKHRNNNNGEQRLRREHLRRIIAAPQRSAFFTSCVCVAKTRKVLGYLQKCLAKIRLKSSFCM